MLEVLSITKALADENRLRVIMMLSHGELCLCQIIEMLGLAPSTVSKHMSILKQARLVETRKDGRWMHYRLAKNGSAEARSAIKWVCNNLKDDKKIKEDEKKLKKLLRISKEELCKRK